jgi:ribosome maturation factor RimP
MNKLKHIVEKYMSSDLVLMDVQEDTRGNYIRVVVDAERPVTLDDTTELSRKLRDDEEIDLLFPSGFRMEVTTPGLDQALQRPFQYRKNKDRQLKVTYLDGDNTRTITGQVVDADDACVILMESGKEISLTYDQITSAKVKISIN